MTRRAAGVGSLILGFLAGIVGVVLYVTTVCSLRLGDLCLEHVRPTEALGLMVVGFGMVLFVLGIVLLAMGTKGE